MTKQITFSEIEAALDAGKVEMMRPWGDWVPARRRGNTAKAGRRRNIPVFMENQVEATISTSDDIFGFSAVRIVS